MGLQQNTDISIRAARVSDWPRGQALLQAAGLPVDDLDENKLIDFLVAEKANQVVGMIGVENFGAVGLLRSLVVAEDVRGLGVGEQLVSALEAAAVAADVTQLWLLTIDAQDFFIRFGFSVVERAGAPNPIQATEEFSELCPDSAHLMVKYLVQQSV